MCRTFQKLYLLNCIWMKYGIKDMIMNVIWIINEKKLAQEPETNEVEKHTTKESERPIKISALCAFVRARPGMSRAKTKTKNKIYIKKQNKKSKSNFETRTCRPNAHYNLHFAQYISNFFPAFAGLFGVLWQYLPYALCSVHMYIILDCIYNVYA